MKFLLWTFGVLVALYLIAFFGMRFVVWLGRPIKKKEQGALGHDALSLNRPKETA